MREWMFGNVDGWINPANSGKRSKDIFDALGHSDVGMNFVFLYEEAKFIGMWDLNKYFRAYSRRHDKNKWDSLPADHAAYKTADKQSQRWTKTTTTVSNEMEQEVLEFIKEKTNEQSN